MGLGSYWSKVLDVLEEIIPVYDKVNSIISLGKDEEFRIRGISGRVKQGNAVLDAGSGFGNMSKTALKICNNDLQITLYDPLQPMLKNTRRLFSNSPSLSCGVFEHIPFQDEKFDAVMCGYSLRDALSLKIAILEIHRVLKKGGRFVIVDLGKPDNSFLRFGVSFYLKVILPIIASVAAGKLGFKFGTLYGTYKLWPQNKKLETLLLEKFSKVEFEKAMMGGAIMVAAYK
ncbi:MAG: methyltransferase domain-containing protein [Thaumarchaeota archaeon]|nr:MAG: methyltransferase domain-containing protein [Nitrososphaerota archaeon]TLX82658.1 MAG: methyltransferase domain-containing protein [Nitrososphaerota archaeon]